MRSGLKWVVHVSWSQVALLNIIAFAALAAVAVALHWQHAAPSVALDSNSGLRSDKRIAFSFDDSPRGAGAFLDLGQRPQVLLGALKTADIAQAVFFANPGRISSTNKGAEMLAAYQAAGHVVANHTFSHKVLSSVSADAFLADVGKAESWLKQQPNYRPWLRFPQLDEGGSNRIKRDAVREGMQRSGLRHGYVTADGWDWYMESQTIEARRAGKPMDVAALRALYIETHVESAEFSDRLARRMFEKPPVQLLLLHDTDLAAMFVADLARALRANGWQIVSADEAYADPVAKTIPDPRVANGTWLEMMAWEKGLKGRRWFPRNNVNTARRLFAERVLHR